MTAIREFATRDALMQAAAAQIAEALKDGISKRGEGFAALSGGGTPEPAYRHLSAMALDWPHVTFLLVDERFVPLTDPSSNEAMLRRALAPALAAGANLAPMFTDDVSLSGAAVRADGHYADKPIDIALMGMGEDGHTASWFSQSPQLPATLDRANTRSVIAVTAPGADGSPQRLTLTWSALARASAIVLLVAGAEKRTLLEDKGRSPRPVDALFELPAAKTVLWAP